MAENTTPTTDADTKSPSEGTSSTEQKPVVGAADKASTVATVDRSTAGKKASDKDGTTLDSNVTKPSVTKPGDGPADTTDPKEVAVTVPANPGDEAILTGTVNAVRKVGDVSPVVAATTDARTEEYDVRGPKNETVRIRRNVETGATERVSN